RAPHPVRGSKNNWRGDGEWSAVSIAYKPYAARGTTRENAERSHPSVRLPLVNSTKLERRCPSGAGAAATHRNQSSSKGRPAPLVCPSRLARHEAESGLVDRACGPAPERD